MRDGARSEGTGVHGEGRALEEGARPAAKRVPGERAQQPSAAHAPSAGVDFGDPAFFEGCSAPERAYRASVLRDIEARVRVDGAHVARAHPERVRQFMPFAALKGYHDLVRDREHVPQPRRAMTDDRALALSQVVAGLEKGDVVRVTFYEDDGYTTVRGAVSEVVEALRGIRVVRRWIPFDAIDTIEVM